MFKSIRFALKPTCSDIPHPLKRAWCTLAHRLKAVRLSPIYRRAIRLARPWIPLAWVLLLIEFFDELHYGFDGAVLPALRSDLGLSYAQVGLLLGLPHILNTLIEPVIMLLGDTRLRKPLILIGGVVILACSTLIMGVQSFPLLLAATLLKFPASGAFVSLSQAALVELSPGRESQAMARWTAAGSLGNLVAPLILAGGFALGWGWRWSYLALALLAAGLVLLVLPYRFGSPETEPASQADASEPAAAPVSLRQLGANLWAALRDPELLRWLFLLQVIDLLLDVFGGYVTLYFTDVVGATPAQASLALSLFMASGLAADLALIPILERLPGRKVVRVTALIALFVYAAWLLVPWPLAKYALLIAISCSTLGWYPVLQAEAFASRPGRKGAILALSSVAGVLGGVITWLVGWVAGLAGLQAAMWLLWLAPIALLVFLPKEKAG